MVLFGSEEGVAEIARECGPLHVPSIRCSSWGTPLVSDLFAAAQSVARTPFVAYANADILLTSSLVSAVAVLARHFGRFWLFCTPWNVWVEESLDFNGDWEGRLEALLAARGVPPRPVGVDVIVFPRGDLPRIPHFAVGRTAWDNWLIYAACKSGLPAVDGTGFIRAVHQNHTGTTHTKGAEAVTSRHQEVRKNLRLAGRWAASFVAADLPYEMCEDGSVRRRKRSARLRLRVRALRSMISPRRVLRSGIFHVRTWLSRASSE